MACSGAVGEQKRQPVGLPRGPNVGGRRVTDAGLMRAEGDRRVCLRGHVACGRCVTEARPPGAEEGTCGSASGAWPTQISQ